MDFSEIKSDLELKIKKSYISTNILLSKSRFIDERSKESMAFSDPTYLPFYYYLASLLNVNSLMEFGFRLGFPSTCFLQGCKNHVQDYFGFHENQSNVYYSSRLARANILDHFKGNFRSYVGLITDNEFIEKFNSCKWDVILVDEEVNYDKHRTYLDLAWKQVNELIVVDYLNRHEPSKKAFLDFCAINNRKPCIIQTRYGVGIIER